MVYSWDYQNIHHSKKIRDKNINPATFYGAYCKWSLKVNDVCLLSSEINPWFYNTLQCGTFYCCVLPVLKRQTVCSGETLLLNVPIITETQLGFPKESEMKMWLYPNFENTKLRSSHISHFTHKTSEWIGDENVTWLKFCILKTLIKSHFHLRFLRKS